MRLQLALNVDDIDTAVDFYSKMFSTEPQKRKPGYANFAIEQPPLKLILFENGEQSEGKNGSLNHLGVEVETADEVVAAEARLSEAGLATTGVDETICCFAEKAETWVHGPDGNRWEWYVKQGDTEQGEYELINKVTESGAGAGQQQAACCAPSPEAAAREGETAGSVAGAGCC